MFIRPSMPIGKEGQGHNGGGAVLHPSVSDSSPLLRADLLSHRIDTVAFLRLPTEYPRVKAPDIDTHPRSPRPR